MALRALPSKFGRMSMYPSSRGMSRAHVLWSHRLFPRSTVARRSITTAPNVRAARDQSSIDYAYMPQDMASQSLAVTMIQVPLLPNNYATPSEHIQILPQEALVEEVVRPQIVTASANGTFIEHPSAMSEVTDNHAVELDVFDLTRKVANAAAMQVTGAAATQGKSFEKRGGAVQEFMRGMFDGVLGSRAMSKA